MDRLTAMQVFVTVVEQESQTAAADRLDLSRPVVSRYLAQLEQWVGARLLHRTTRKLSLTAAGEQTLARCRQVLALTADMAIFVAPQHDAPQGVLRLTASTSFGQAQLAQLVTRYVERYPGVVVDMLLLDRAVNLVEERIDLAIRITNDLDPNLLARRLTVCRSVLCAAPAYLHAHGAPASVADLALHSCLTHSYFGKSLWQFDCAGQPQSVAVSGGVSSNEASSLLQVALSGAGIALLPTYLAATYVKSGQLRALLPEARPRELTIYALYSSARHVSAPLRTMLDFLAQQFGPEPQWDA
jgi:DNA-binding transcriptional LysR family regulator